MEGDGTACVAPFQIDQFEVTNEDYLAYWQSVPAEKRKFLGFRNSHYPVSWARTDCAETKRDTSSATV